MEIHSFIPQIFMGHLLLTRHYSRHWWYSDLKKQAETLAWAFQLRWKDQETIFQSKKHGALLRLVAQSCPTL